VTIALKVLLRLTSNVYAPFINISNDTERRAALSAIAELLVNFDAPNHISGMTEAKVAKFCMQVKYIKC